MYIDYFTNNCTTAIITIIIVIIATVCLVQSVITDWTEMVCCTLEQIEKPKWWFKRFEDKLVYFNLVDNWMVQF